MCVCVFVGLRCQIKGVGGDASITADSLCELNILPATKTFTDIQVRSSFKKHQYTTFLLFTIIGKKSFLSEKISKSD